MKTGQLVVQIFSGRVATLRFSAIVLLASLNIGVFFLWCQIVKTIKISPFLQEASRTSKPSPLYFNFSIPNLLPSSLSYPSLLPIFPFSSQSLESCVHVLWPPHLFSVQLGRLGSSKHGRRSAILCLSSANAGCQRGRGGEGPSNSKFRAFECLCLLPLCVIFSSVPPCQGQPPRAKLILHLSLPPFIYRHVGKCDVSRGFGSGHRCESLPPPIVRRQIIWLCGVCHLLSTLLSFFLRLLSLQNRQCCQKICWWRCCWLPMSHFLSYCLSVALSGLSHTGVLSFLLLGVNR